MMIEKTNAMRVLDQRDISYEIFNFSPEIHSAVGVAEAIGHPPEHVYKTLVVMRSKQKPMLIITPGDVNLNLKQVAKAVGEKKVRMASQQEAENLTGLLVGGISALALLDKPFDVFIDHSAKQLSHIIISAGKRGINLRMVVDDLINVTQAKVIQVI